MFTRPASTQISPFYNHLFNDVKPLRRRHLGKVLDVLELDDVREAVEHLVGLVTNEDDTTIGVQALQDPHEVLDTIAIEGGVERLIHHE